MTDPDESKILSRRQYLMIRTYMTLDENLDHGPVNHFMVMEAVSSTALAHPEWDMEEKHTWNEWEKLHKEK
jgi:hypothetical protein